MSLSTTHINVFSFLNIAFLCHMLSHPVKLVLCVMEGCLEHILGGGCPSVQLDHGEVLLPPTCVVALTFLMYWHL